MSDAFSRLEVTLGSFDTLQTSTHVDLGVIFANRPGLRFPKASTVCVANNGSNDAFGKRSPVVGRVDIYLPDWTGTVHTLFR